jgi:uncharacterized protein YjbI with pentapeptide repeats
MTRPHVQAALAVIGRREVSYDGPWHIGLTGAALRGALLFYQPEPFRLVGADLTGANLIGADLTEGNLAGARRSEENAVPGE